MKIMNERIGLDEGRNLRIKTRMVDVGGGSRR